MVIFVHTGWSGYFLLKNQHPILLDDVAVRFPDLKLVVVHAGENYYEECVMMMLKNPNVYANTGWWGFLQPLETNIRFLKYAKHFMVLDKVLWGTDNYDCREDVPFVKSLPAAGGRAQHRPRPTRAHRRRHSGLLGQQLRPPVRGRRRLISPEPRITSGYAGRRNALARCAARDRGAAATEAPVRSRGGCAGVRGLPHRPGPGRQRVHQYSARSGPRSGGGRTGR